MEKNKTQYEKNTNTTRIHELSGLLETKLKLDNSRKTKKLRTYLKMLHDNTHVSIVIPMHFTALCSE